MPELIGTTWRTPATALAPVASKDLALPPKTGQRATVAISIPATLMSMPYTAEPSTFGGFSSRLTRLPISLKSLGSLSFGLGGTGTRSEEHTSELQSRVDLVCRL